VLQNDGHFGTVAFASSANSPSSSSPDITIVSFLVPFPPGIIANGRGLTLVARNAKPKSKGRVILQSSDPRVPVLADPAYLTDSRDLGATLESFELSLELATTPAVRPFVDQPIFNTSGLNTRAGRLQFIRENGQPGYHPASSCIAGRDPAHSVVNSALRVWGIRNLRVVDGSVLPEMPGLALYVAIIAVAEVASQIILQGD
jgi:choline dehydrogenase